jgi:hypothetical protein
MAQVIDQVSQFNANVIPGIEKGFFSGVSSTVESMSGITAFGLITLILYSITKVLNFYEIGPNIYGSYLVFYVFLITSAYNLPRYHLIR